MKKDFKRAIDCLQIADIQDFFAKRKYRFLYFFFAFLFVILSSNILYSSDLDDIFRNMESPEVNYKVENEIKTITVPQKPIRKVPQNRTAPTSSIYNKNAFKSPEIIIDQSDLKEQTIKSDKNNNYNKKTKVKIDSKTDNSLLKRDNPFPTKPQKTKEIASTSINISKKNKEKTIKKVASITANLSSKQLINQKINRILL